MKNLQFPPSQCTEFIDIIDTYGRRSTGTKIKYLYIVNNDNVFTDHNAAIKYSVESFETRLKKYNGYDKEKLKNLEKISDYHEKLKYIYDNITVTDLINSDLDYNQWLINTIDLEYSCNYDIYCDI